MTSQIAPNRGSQQSRSQSTALHIFHDDILLKIFNLCRPVLLHQGESNDDHIIIEREKWDGERWWYRIAHICRSWRQLVLASASHLGLFLVCTYGTPVADMLAYSPLLPLMIDYGDEDREVTSEDEEGILLALRRGRRVRRIRLWMSASSIRRLVAAMDGEFPMLENLYIKPLTDDDNDLSLPDTFKASHLRHFTLRNIIYSPGMFHLLPSTPYVPSTERSQFTLYYGPQLWRSLRMFIHILDDDSLLNIFHFCRPITLDDDGADIIHTLEDGKLDHERWWYKLAHVCRRWRCLILTSASLLRLSLLCTYSTPVADMLAHSPPLPLIISYTDNIRDITTEDDEGIMLAFQLRHRIRGIRVVIPFIKLQKLIVALDEEFPILEYLIIIPQTGQNSGLTLPNTFQAPRLRHLMLSNFASPIGSPLITTCTGLITLGLIQIRSSPYSHPDNLFRQLSLLPQLKTLVITFHYPIPNRDVERQLLDRPIITDVTLPNLREFWFRSASAYLEAILPQMTMPLLDHLHVEFFHQLNFSIPHLLQFLGAAENLRFSMAVFRFFRDSFEIEVYPRDYTVKSAFKTEISCKHLDRQVTSAAQISHALRTVFSPVEFLTIKFSGIPISSEMDNEADRTQWRKLLGSFSNVKTLRLHDDLCGYISCSLLRYLKVEDGETPMEMLSELKVLECQEHGPRNRFNTFINARKNAGHPVTLVCRP